MMMPRVTMLSHPDYSGMYPITYPETTTPWSYSFVSGGWSSGGPTTNLSGVDYSGWPAAIGGFGSSKSFALSLDGIIPPDVVTSFAQGAGNTIWLRKRIENPAGASVTITFYMFADDGCWLYINGASVSPAVTNGSRKVTYTTAAESIEVAVAFTDMYPGGTYAQIYAAMRIVVSLN